VLLAILGVSGCSVKRIESGVYHSSKGYRVAIPSPQWGPVDGSPADLELRHRSASAGMAAHAVCEERTTRHSSRILARQLLVGVRDRSVIERGEVDVAGRPAVRAVVDGRLEGSEAKVRIETVVVKDDRCVYDFMYVAPVSAFAATRPDFNRFVDSFRTE
jgi:hypothetical protein